MIHLGQDFVAVDATPRLPSSVRWKCEMLEAAGEPLAALIITREVCIYFLL
jgi:hypothetical protein